VLNIVPLAGVVEELDAAIHRLHPVATGEADGAPEGAVPSSGAAVAPAGRGR